MKVPESVCGKMMKACRINYSADLHNIKHVIRAECLQNMFRVMSLRLLAVKCLNLQEGKKPA